ncbi:MAG TPA: hypothetical protein VKF81_04310, partial [Blastocatellia bacterium]|nr:hypothetical protein [Blastocatellia bacterium]
MARLVLRIVPILLLVSFFISIGKRSAHSDSNVLHATRQSFDASYRSRSSNHKVLVQETDRELRESLISEGASIIEDYGAFVLMSAPAAAAERVSARPDSGSGVRDDMNVLLLRAGALDTSEEHASANSLAESSSADEGLYLVQFVGPIKKRWVNQLASATEIISYIPNNAYLVRANRQSLREIDRLRNKEQSSIQWAGPFKPGYKIAPEIARDSNEELNVTVQLASGINTANEIEDLILRSSASMTAPPTTVMNYTNVRIKIRVQMLDAVARISNVVWIEPWQEPALQDEKQGLIVAGKLTGAETSASSYLAWLQSKGITSTPDFIVDVADTGIDRGVLDPQVLHKDFL